MRFLYDAKLKKPGCVLLAAIAGTSRAPIHLFHEWLTAPTPDMKVYEVTEEQLKKLVEISNRKGG